MKKMEKEHAKKKKIVFLGGCEQKRFIAKHGIF